MGTGSMQWTAAEMDGMRCNGLLWLCKFMVFSCGCKLTTTPDPALILTLVSNFAIGKLVLMYIHKKETVLNAIYSFSFLSCSLWRHLSCSPFCHVLSGAISLITRAGTCAHVHLFSEHRSKRQTQKTWRAHPHHTSTSSTIMIMNRCSFDGCGNRPTKHGNGRCRAHGGRTKCNHLGCDSFAKKGGMCRSHRPSQDAKVDP